MPAAPDPIVSTSNAPGQPYDATSEGPVAGWDSVDANSGPSDMSGHVTGDFESGPGPWKQT
jgi:hypothetical protein